MVGSMRPRHCPSTVQAPAYREVFEIVAVNDDTRVPEDAVLDPLALRVDDGQKPIGVDLEARSARRIRGGAQAAPLTSGARAPRVRTAERAPFERR